jgi:flagellar hook-associated protein 2
MVEQLAEVERAPQRQLLAEQLRMQEQNQALGSLRTQLGVLRNRVSLLQDPALYDSRTATSSEPTRGTVTVAAGATVGQYAFAIAQLATASVQTGTANAGRRLHDTSDVSGLTLSSAGFATTVTAGTFTVNGQQVTVAADDTLGSVFEKIATATGHAVAAAYDPDTDRITLSSAAPVVLGSGTDSSNFLAVARLYGNGTHSVTSHSELGAVRLGASLAAANFGTPLTGGSSGSFKINGVAIQYDTAVDTVAGLLDRINASTAGVVASYDAVNDRFALTNKATGSLGVALEDGPDSNFLAASGLLGGSLTLGRNLEYTVNGGGTLISQSNTITAASSGLAGLNVAALAAGAFTVTVGVDTARIRSAVVDFVTEYNRTQAQISTQTASSTDAKGKVTAGLLAEDPTVNDLSRQLRSLTAGTLSGLSGSLTRLDRLGFATNGYDDTFSTADLTGLDELLRDDLGSVEAFFSDAAGGLATKLDTYLETAIGDSGSVTSRQTTLTRQAGSIDTQVADMEKFVQQNRERLVASFVAMEQAQANLNQQLQYLLQSFGTSSRG